MGGSTPRRLAQAQQQAADWYARLSSGQVDDAQRSRWQQWLQAAPEHAAAWAQVEEVVGRFQGLPADIAHGTLQRAGVDRRAALKLLSASVAVGGSAFWGMRSELWQRSFADYRTATAERRQWILADGTVLHLNARSAVDVRFDQAQRLLHLYHGEITVDTGHAPAYAAIPFLVQTSRGSLRVMGTRFMVSDLDGEVEVSLFEGALRVQPSAAPPHDLAAGQALRLGPGATWQVYPVDPHVAAWEQGLIFADGMPLARYLRHLAQHRRGLLGCDARAGALLVSGVFALDDSDRLLQQLERILPVKVRYFSRYWVRVEALTAAR
ncbi:FecR family protein [Pseudomonas flavescens]|uniref:FecR family protein n=1 Tax=Phytopseudomonas flavescens TaxID=29435 RepID=A0A1G8JQQ5_9GAMM|nr:FecR domain-containing protein [Pseudomonas flavescens]SDI33619.1 FecR family protein [Pseudomonas flavescens]